MAEASGERVLDMSKNMDGLVSFTCFRLELMGFKQQVCFPEQAVNWEMDDREDSIGDEAGSWPQSFAYTGGATVCSSAAGAGGFATLMHQSRHDASKENLEPNLGRIGSFHSPTML